METLVRPFANALGTEQPPGRSAPDPRRLDEPLRAARPEALAELGLVTVGDVLEALPFRFEDFSTVQALEGLEAGEEATVLVRVRSVAERRTSRRNLRIVSAAVSDAHGGDADVVWFNQRYLARTLEPGMLLLVRGEARAGRRGVEIAARSHEILATAAEAEAGDAAAPLPLVPVYRASSKVSSRVVRAVAEAALAAVDAVGDPLPATLRVSRRLPSRRDAVAAGHRPRREHEARVARRRLAYEELLLLQVALLEHRRTTAEGLRARALPAGGAHAAAYLAGLPFALTGAQERALAAIDADLGRPSPMQRLLQGDVGSGKTAVALAALVRAVDAGAQGALMAPTEVLAVQHAATAERLLGGLGVERCLLTAEVPKREQTARRQRIEAGEPLIAIGTHALLNVAFPALAVAVVDEQHRFGVEQRGGLGAAGGGEAPHVLHMTATPIPRSLALTVYGDLDVTVIDELPAGRQPVLTRIVPEQRRASGYGWIVEQVAAGRQAYIVCPLVEGSALVEARAAEEEAARLAAGPLAAVRVGCLHGQMRGPERLEGMRRFIAGELDVLVATTVIEVGVDVPNATIMVVEDADRFGLSQLHQLRGRVGRGAEASFCFLYESAEPSEEGRRRLRALVEHSSGFELAEIDLEMRGEGHLLGQLQSGRSDFRHARLPRDRRLLERARADAAAAIEAGLDPLLAAAAAERFGALIAGMRRG
jgi:ATP-dependent DNA helicase RecG